MAKLLGSLDALYGVIGGAAKGALVALVCATASHADTVTVAALGDSLTHGYGLPVEDGFVPQLEGWLQGQGLDVDVMNAGVSGDTTAGGLARLAWTLTPEVDALIVALGGNDLLRGIPPEVSRANLEGIMAQAAERGLPVLLVGLPAPGNYGPAYKTAFDAIFPDLAATYGALMDPSFLAPIAALDNPAPVMQPDGIHPNKEGVALVVEHLGPRVVELINRVE